jgi:hypothetical protein
MFCSNLLYFPGLKLWWLFDLFSYPFDFFLIWFSGLVDLLQIGSLYFPVAVCLSFSVVLYMAGTSTYKRGLERARMKKKEEALLCISLFYVLLRKLSTFKVEVMVCLAIWFI